MHLAKDSPFRPNTKIPIISICIDGKTVSRPEIIEALRELYRDACEYNSQIPGHRGDCRFPDVEAILDHIEEHGLSPKYF